MPIHILGSQIEKSHNIATAVTVKRLPRVEVSPVLCSVVPHSVLECSRHVGTAWVTAFCLLREAHEMEV
jgi:hypothetical protein